MNWLSLKQWLDMFSSKELSFDEFTNNALVLKNNNTTVKLIDYKKFKKSDLKILYKYSILKKHYYLEKFYNRNLKVDIQHLCSFDTKKLSFNPRKDHNTKNIIRNLYVVDLYKNTTTVYSNTPSFLKVIIDLFKHQIIDYKLVTPSVLDNIRKKLFASMLSGLYFRTSIMNPFLVYSLISKYMLSNKKEQIVFTPTLGWSSYMMGLMNIPNIKKYVGIDVIPKVCNTTEKLSKFLYPNKEIDIYCKPSELIYQDKSFLKKYKNKSNIIFFSPPYFQLENYEGDMQSINQYKTYEQWLEKYWTPTVKLCYHVLHKEGKMCYIISSYTYKDKLYDLQKDLVNITKENKFKLFKKKKFNNMNVGFTKHRSYKEIAYIFSK